MFNGPDAVNSHNINGFKYTGKANFWGDVELILKNRLKPAFYARGREKRGNLLSKG